jgi:pimeloyl-ACP methyl ester carboxylesterase
MCRDEYAFNTYDGMETAVSNNIPEEIVAGMLQSSAQMFDMCSYWGAGSAAAIENQAVVSNIPTLILVGEFDTATPPAWAQLTASTLSNSYVFEFPGSGHSLLTMVPCSMEITADFLKNPMSKPSGSCIQDIEWPYFE